MKLFSLPPILSLYQSSPLIKARQEGKDRVTTSLDLGISPIEASISADKVTIGGSVVLSWAAIEEIIAKPNSCFYITDNSIKEIREFSELSGRTFSLVPTEDAPAMYISGFTMHRIKNTTPLLSVKAMARAIAPCHGKVLDTTTGLGYACIELAKTASEVITIELEPAAQEMMRFNPWSQAALNNPKITQIIGDCIVEIQQFPSGTFSAVFHDPPSMNIAGDLYSGTFYQQVFRVLRPRGKMFHYIADPQSDSGSRVTKGVIKRLMDAGFKKVIPRPDAFGVVAYKT